MSGQRGKIIIVEDDPGVRFFLEEALKTEGYGTASFESFEASLSSVSDNNLLIIMDINLPGISGLHAIDEVKRRSSLPILIITAYGTKKNALEAIERGATDFFTKPVALDELKVMVRRLVETRKLKKEAERLRSQDVAAQSFHGVVGRSEAMRRIFETVEKGGPERSHLSHHGRDGCRQGGGGPPHSPPFRTGWRDDCGKLRSYPR